MCLFAMIKKKKGIHNVNRREKTPKNVEKAFDEFNENSLANYKYKFNLRGYLPTVKQ